MNPVVLGLVAGAFTTFASLPQIIYVLRTRSMRDVSLVTLCMFAAGVGLWIVYGIVIGAMPVIVWNVISLALYLIQIALKLVTAGNDVRFDATVEIVETAASPDVAVHGASTRSR